MKAKSLVYPVLNRALDSSIFDLKDKGWKE